MIPYWIRPYHVYSELRHWFMYHLPGYVLRAKNGWAPVDTWNFDRYLALVLSQALEHMADRAHGYPTTMESVEEWQSWLRDKAACFKWYYDDDIGLRPDMTDDEKTQALDFYDMKMKHFHDVVLPEFCKYFGNLWD